MRTTFLAASGFAFTLLFAAMVLAPELAAAESLNAEEARAFVVGRDFSFNCFEGSNGSGKVFADGSVAGIISLRQRPARFVQLPANTLRTHGAAVCGFVKGMNFEPCFDVVRTGPSSFRGTLAGVATMWCDFVSNSIGKPQLQARRAKSRSRTAEAAE